MRKWNELYGRDDVQADVSIYCPYCRKHTSLTPAPTTATISHEKVRVAPTWKDPHGRMWWIGLCNSCKRPVLVRDEGHEVYPQPLPPPTDDRIPTAIREDLDEAKLCFSVGALRGSATMARRAIQAACRNKGATKGKLENEIRDLADKKIITQDLKDWADNVRWVGNDAAHPDSPSVEKEDAEDILNLAEQFLHVVYVAPALAKELKSKRLKKKGQKP